MVIDFSKVSKSSDLRLLSGRDNGVEARKLFHVTINELTTETIVKITDNKEVVVSNSYFLGLLEDLFRIHTSKEDLLHHIDYKELSHINQKELLRGINRGFASVINALS